MKAKWLAAMGWVLYVAAMGWAASAAVWSVWMAMSLEAMRAAAVWRPGI